MISKITAEKILKCYGYTRTLLPSLIRGPLGYFLYITGRCNLECKYCWQREMPERGSESRKSNRNELTGGEWIKIIKSAPKFSFIGITGGEPLLHPDFEKIIRFLGGRFAYTINTNGILLEDKILENLIEYKTSNLSVSIDGFSDINDAYRKRVGLFNHLVARIERFNSLKVKMHSQRPFLTIKTVLLDQLSEQLIEFYLFCDEVLKADCLNISLLKTVDHAQFDFRVYESLVDIRDIGEPECFQYKHKEKIIEVLSSLLKLSKRKRCKVLLYPKMYQKLAIEKLFQSNGKGVSKPCYFPWSIVVILSDGNIIPCLSLKTANIRDLDYDLKRINAIEKYYNFLKWRDMMNRIAKSPSECNMCCFSEVSI